MILLFNFSLLKSMEEMAVMMGAQMGASTANQAISKMFQKMATSIQKDHSFLQDSMKSFSNNAVQAQNNEAQALGKIFAEAIKQIGSQEGDQSKYTHQMQQYIFNAINFHKPQIYYLLEGATTFDQVFANGTMYTPNGPLWKNIFAKGNWEYDHIANSFAQLSNVPVFHTKTNPKSNTQKQSSSQAAYNSIFTEYFASTSSYEIACQITVNQVHYPFFVGVIFNKTRWISGNADSLTKGRIVGIYGTSPDDIGTYFAEQYSKTSSAKTKSGLPQVTIMYPLEQIIQKKVKKQTDFSAKIFDNIQDPPTFNVRIITSANKIKFKIWQKTSKEPSEFITINSSHKDLYLYHGIGFLSPGAISEFKLIAPQELLFSHKAQDDFTQEVETLINTKIPVRRSRENNV